MGDNLDRIDVLELFKIERVEAKNGKRRDGVDDVDIEFHAGCLAQVGGELKYEDVHKAEIAPLI
jgi:hypothetical protein